MAENRSAAPRPRVGYVLKKFPRLSETFILNEVLELQRQGVDVHVLSLYTPDEGRFHADVALLENPITYVPELRPRDLFRRLDDQRGALPAVLARAADALEYVLDLGEVDGLPVLKRALPLALEIERLGLQHVHAHFATIAARAALCVRHLTGVPFSVTAHAKDIYRETVRPDRFARIVDDAEFLVTVCDANRDYILDALAPGREDKVVRLYNGVDLDRFAASASPAGDGVPRLLSVGRLVPKKGFPVLLDACAELMRRGVRFECEIVGDGEDRAALEARAAALGLGAHVTFAGALPQDEVVRRTRRADLMCLSCVTDADGNKDALPTTLLEGLACGRAVVSTPVGGVPEIITHGENGLLVPEGDVAALADALADLLRDPATRARMGEAGRRRAERDFDLRANVGSLRARMLGAASRGAAGSAPSAPASKERRVLAEGTTS